MQSLTAPVDPNRLGHIRFLFDGEEVSALEGQSIAAALLASGQRILRYTSRAQEPRSLFCGMGMCFDCLVRVNGRANVRACLTPVAEGLRVETQRSVPSGEASR
jgi:predicted molibdopterin-dependent oxidoreductase YjgC